MMKLRGAQINPKNRFESTSMSEDLSDFASDPELYEAKSSLSTQVHYDDSQSILSKNDSPDVPFDVSINPYRGCEHGCIYCYARPTHELLGLSSGLDFESKIMVKREAPQLLEAALRKRTWRPQPVCFSGVTDCYQPLEGRFRLTRGCLEVLYKYKNPAMIISKSALILRDRDLLARMAAEDLVSVAITITSLDDKIAASLEPRAARPKFRLKAIEELSKAGVPVCVMVAPLIPAITDEELPAILQAAADAGAINAGYTLVRLPFAVKDVFEEWVRRMFPLRADKILNGIRSHHGGQLSGSEFGARMRGVDPKAEQIARMFAVFKKKYGLNKPSPSLRCDRFSARPEARSLFDE